MSIFLDCGLYSGQIIKEYTRDGIIDDTWTIYSFEPNPKLDIKTYMKSIPQKINLIKKAVWIKDGKVKFIVSGRHDAAHIEEVRPDDSNAEDIMVDCVDFSRFVSELPNERIICSMDIEGAEYEVLAKMLEENTIDKIELLDIEFHSRILDKYTTEDTLRYIDDIEKRGVKVKLKVEVI